MHLASGTPAAVKVITARGAASDEVYQREFRREVRAMAGLSHPGVVDIYDFGTTPRGAVGALRGEIAAGAPWLAMELADLGDLDRLPRPRAWPELRRILVEILQALGHAHARGVIHRDLKPGNVLVARQGTDVRLLLSDFGIAHSDDPSMSRDADPTGTPQYMAPEQFGVHWRDYGPWTDLYALGCMAMELCTGTTPFHGLGAVALALKHVREPAPRRTPDFPVPEGFVDWMLRLLEKAPTNRYGTAAEAAFALEMLGPGGGEWAEGAETGALNAAPDTLPVGAPQLAALFSGAQRMPQGSDATVAQMPRMLEAVLTPDGLEPAICPPLPMDWRERRPLRRRAGAGFGLFGLRQHGLVGRQAERDQLWATLGDVRATGRARGLLVEGPAGQGKTRLCRWLSWRAAELGGAVALTVNHSAMHGPQDGLGAMVGRFFRGEGLDDEALFERVDDHLRTLGFSDTPLRHAHAQALASLVIQGDDTRLRISKVSVRFGSRRERYTAVWRWLALLARQRPVIICLEDLHWGLDAVGFLSHALSIQAEEGAGVLILGTLRPGALPERPAERDALALLTNAETLPLDPLPNEEAQALLAELIGPNPAFARLLLERAGGHPLFAVQLVADCIERKLVTDTDGGVALSSDAEVPADLDELFERRIEVVLRDARPADRKAFYAAAALGQGVDGHEWGMVCEGLGVEPPPALLEALFESGLACQGHLGWSWAFEAARQALARAAQREGVWAAVHLACAEAMLVGVENGACPTERQARHLVAAGADLEALEPLYRAAVERFEAGDYDLAGAVIEQRVSAMERVNCAPSDHRWGENWLLRARIALLRSVEEAEALVERTIDAAVAHGWLALRGQLVEMRGRLALAAGDMPRAAEYLADAEALFERGGEAALLAHCRRDLGSALLSLGQLDRARDLVEDARAAFQRVGDLNGEGRCLIALADIARRRGRVDNAVRALARARRRFERAAARLGVAHSARLVADMARLQGRHGQAERSYVEAIDRFTVLGAAAVDQARAGLGLLRIAEGRDEAARPLLRGAAERLERQGLRGGAALAHAGLFLLSARAMEWPAAESAMEAVKAALHAIGAAEPDTVDTLRLGAEVARAAGQESLAKDAETLGRTRLSLTNLG